MIEITEPERDSAFENASETTKQKYRSPQTGAALWNIASRYSLTTDELYTPFVITVGDVILGLRQRTELPDIITEATGVPQETAVAITGDLIEFLDTPLPPDPSEVDDLSAELTAAEEAMERRGGQASDQTKATYTTSQEALLRESGGR